MSTVVESAEDLVPATTPGSEPSPALAAEITSAAERLEGKDALAIIAWATERFGTDLVVASSFQDLVLVDLAVKVDPNAEIVFLDTGFHFPETLAYLRRAKSLYNLNLLITEPEVGSQVWPCGSARCCEFRKVAPLNKVLATKSAWITGVKRVDTPERTAAPVVSWDNKGLVKINPLAAWSDDDVDRYIAEHNLPHHPLNAVGYVSIGCAPTTRPIAEGENPRNGRWPDSNKTECGLHL